MPGVGHAVLQVTCHPAEGTRFVVVGQVARGAPLRQWCATATPARACVDGRVAPCPSDHGVACGCEPMDGRFFRSPPSDRERVACALPVSASPGLHTPAGPSRGVAPPAFAWAEQSVEPVKPCSMWCATHRCNTAGLRLRQLRAMRTATGQLPRQIAGAAPGLAFKRAAVHRACAFRRSSQLSRADRRFSGPRHACWAFARGRDCIVEPFPRPTPARSYPPALAPSCISSASASMGSSSARSISRLEP